MLVTTLDCVVCDVVLYACDNAGLCVVCDVVLYACDKTGLCGV